MPPVIDMTPGSDFEWRLKADHPELYEAYKRRLQNPPNRARMGVLTKVQSSSGEKPWLSSQIEKLKAKVKEKVEALKHKSKCFFGRDKCIEKFMDTLYGGPDNWDEDGVSDFSKCDALCDPAYKDCLRCGDFAMPSFARTFGEIGPERV